MQIVRVLCFERFELLDELLMLIGAIGLVDHGLAEHDCAPSLITNELISFC